MLQSNFFCFFCADITCRCCLLSTLSILSIVERICICYSIRTGQCYYFILAVPTYLAIHDFTNRTQWQISTAIIQNGINHATRCCFKLLHCTIDYDCKIWTYLNLNILCFCSWILFIGCCVCSGTTQCDNFISFVPVYIFAHHFTNRTQWQIGATIIQNRIHCCTRCCLEICIHSINHDRNIRS